MTSDLDQDRQLARRWVLLCAAILGSAVVAVVAYLIALELPRLRLQWKGATFKALDDGTIFRIHAASLSLTDADVTALKQFPDLQDVALVNTAVTDAVVLDLVRLERLQFVDLSGTRITDAALQRLAERPTLRSVRLVDCPNITPFGLLQLASLPQLDSLMIGSMPLNGEQYQRLRGLSPYDD